MEMPVTKQEFWDGFLDLKAEGYCHAGNFTRQGTDAIYDELEANSNHEYKLDNICHAFAENDEWLWLKDTLESKGWFYKKLPNGAVVYQIELL